MDNHELIKDKIVEDANLEIIRLDAENRLLKKILEGLLKIEISSNQLTF